MTGEKRSADAAGLAQPPLRRLNAAVAQPRTAVTPALLETAFGQLGRSSADDIIARLQIPTGAWTRDLRDLERLHQDWSGTKPIADEDAHGELENRLSQMEKNGLLAVLRDVAKHRVDEGATGPEATAATGLNRWHRNLGGEIHCYAAFKAVDAGQTAEEACRRHQVPADRHDHVLDHAMMRWAEGRRMAARQARRHDSGEVPNAAAEDDDDDALPYVPPRPLRAQSAPQPETQSATGRWLAKAAETIRQREPANRQVTPGPNAVGGPALVRRLRERMQPGLEVGGTSSAGLRVPTGQADKTAFRGKLWELGRALAAYKSKHAEARHGAPYLDVIGFRGDGAPQPHGGPERRKIDDLLDQIVPPDRRYNGMRQNIVDLVLDSPAAAAPPPISRQAPIYDSESNVADRMMIDLAQRGRLQFDSAYKAGQAMAAGFEDAMERIGRATASAEFVQSLGKTDIKTKVRTRIDAFFTVADQVGDEMRRPPARLTQMERDAASGPAIASARNEIAHWAGELVPDRDGCIRQRKALVELVASRRHAWMDPRAPEPHEMEAMFLPTEAEHAFLKDREAPYSYVMNAARTSETRHRQRALIDLPRQETALRALAASIDRITRLVAERDSPKTISAAVTDHDRQGAVAARIDARTASSRARAAGLSR